MKKLTLFIMLFVIGSSSSFGQVTLPEHFFHELKGLEDSSGVTHLFYSLYNKYEDEYACGDRTISYLRTDNHIHHFNISTASDSVLFEQYSSEHCDGGGGYRNQRIFDFTFYDQNPGRWIKGNIYNSGYSIEDYSGNNITFFLPVPVAKARKVGSQSYFPEEFFLNSTQDSLFVQTESNISTLRFPGEGANWPQFNDGTAYEAYTDSVAIPWDIIAQHPAYDSLYFARNEQNQLFRTDSGYSGFAKVDIHSFSRDLYFDTNNTHIYAPTTGGLLISDDMGNEHSWTFTSVSYNTNAPHHLTIDHQVTGHLFVSDSTEVLHSTNHGDTFAPLHSFETEITGLYKKPDSDILYALTKKELFELNIATKETTSLKKLPVSVENEPTFNPQEVKLEQNYPNPFNPATVIRYQLAGNSLVRLEVFDITGRKVAVLVDGKKQQVGTYQVTFNADALSSGVYFYRLQAGGETVTLRMTLMK